MEYKLTGKNGFVVTKGLEQAVRDKLGKLEKYFTPETLAHVTMSVNKDRQKVEVTIPVKGNIIRAEDTSMDMYASIDQVQDEIERQLKKYKNKMIDAKQSGEGLSRAFLDEEYDEDDSIQIDRVKRFAMKPMDPEEACVQMELLGHSFYVFRNSETDEVNVVYKRKGGSYGLIEPEF